MRAGDLVGVLRILISDTEPPGVVSGRFPTVDFRISHSLRASREGIGGLRYRAGFEDWDDPGPFVVQLEEATGYDAKREAVAWRPVARFDHGRPHDVFDPAEGLHLDLYRRGASETDARISFSQPLGLDDPLSAFTRLQAVFTRTPNLAYLLDYYCGDVDQFNPDVLRI